MSERICHLHSIPVNGAQECSICVALDEKNDALSLLASATDLLNSWAREMSVREAYNEQDIKGVVDRLWSAISTRMSSSDAKWEETRRELAISMRVCGNWRDFPGAPNAEVENDWQYALRTIAERDEFKEKFSRIKQAMTELDNAITVRTPTEYDAGYNSGLQAAITTLEALL